MNKTLKKIALVGALGGTLAFSAFKTVDNHFELSKNMEILTAVVREANTYYVDEIQPATLLKTGIDAMLKSLDPYTEFYSESEIEDYRFMTTGQYGGIGAVISKRDDYVMVSEPYEGWPAQKADVRAGDIILEIDGLSTKGKTVDMVSKMLKGEPSTNVKLLLKREGEPENITKTLVRQEIKVKNVPYYGMINENTGYIKFAGFRTNASNEVREALLDLKKNPNFKYLVLDLRGNPGGLLDEAVKAVNIFVDRGQMVVNTKGKVAEWNKQYKTEYEPTDLTTPMVVLIDKGSASASEIVSGSLQDYDRAVVVGRNTFGKGLVQTTRPLPYNTQMKITTSKYYIPSGRCIQALDYSHKDENGRATRMEDSARRAFKTKNGRAVYDGNGIRPDLEVERDKYPDIVLSLGERRLFFDYATRYRIKNGSIGDAKAFHLTEDDWSDFMAFLKDKSYEYTTDTEKQLQEFEKTAQDENYYEAVKADLAQMKERLKADKREDVKKYKAQIMEILEEEIASRYYYQAGRVMASFNDDKDIAKALGLFADMGEYKIILAVK